MILDTFGKRSEYKLEIYLKIKFDLKMTEKKDFRGNFYIVKLHVFMKVNIPAEIELGN